MIEHTDKPIVEELYGLRVVARTSWGLSDTIVLRGPAAVDEEGNPTGPDELEVKISAPTRMDLGDWFKDEVKYTLEFGPEDAQDVLPGVAYCMGPGSIVFPCMEVVEKTSWGLSTTCRLQTDTGRGKYLEVKVIIPWPEDRFLKEGQVFNVLFEPAGAPPEEVDPPEEPLPDERPYQEQDLRDRVREAVRCAREYDRAAKLLLEPREYVSRTVVEGTARIQAAIDAWEDDDADEAPVVDLDQLAAALTYVSSAARSRPQETPEASFACMLWNYAFGGDDDADDE